MIEQEPNQIYIPSDAEKLAVMRYEKLQARMKVEFNGSLAGPDTRQWAFYPTMTTNPDGSQNLGYHFGYTSAYARAVFARAERSLEKDLTESGVNDVFWRKDWQNLMEGNLPKAAILDTSEEICSKGHLMKDRAGQYHVCGICKEVHWNKTL